MLGLRRRKEGGAVVPLEWDLGLEVDWRRDGCFLSLYLYLQRALRKEHGCESVGYEVSYIAFRLVIEVTWCIRVRISLV